MDPVENARDTRAPAARASRSFVTLSPSRSSDAVMPFALSARTAVSASSSVSPATNRVREFLRQPVVPNEAEDPRLVREIEQGGAEHQSRTARATASVTGLVMRTIGKVGVRRDDAVEERSTARGRPRSRARAGRTRRGRTAVRRGRRKCPWPAACAIAGSLQCPVTSLSIARRLGPSAVDDAVDGERLRRDRRRRVELLDGDSMRS